MLSCVVADQAVEQKDCAQQGASVSNNREIDTSAEYNEVHKKEDVSHGEEQESNGAPKEEVDARFAIPSY